MKADKVVFGGHCKNLQEIRTWQSGLLVLDADEGVGTDTKFAKDAIVFILAEVKKSSIFQQMLGRGSRSRGVCQGTLFVLTKESPE